MVQEFEIFSKKFSQKLDMSIKNEICEENVKDCDKDNFGTGVNHVNSVWVKVGF